MPERLCFILVKQPTLKVYQATSNFFVYTIVAYSIKEAKQYLHKQAIPYITVKYCSKFKHGIIAINELNKRKSCDSDFDI